MVDVSWDPATDKQTFLQDDPATSTMEAVQNGWWAACPSQPRHPASRNVSAVVDLAEAIREAPGE